MLLSFVDCVTLTFCSFAQMRIKLDLHFMINR